MVQADNISAYERRNRIETETASAMEEYFANEIHTKEMSPICLLGCGAAGTELAGIFRLKPDYVPAYLPQFYPVRAIAMDTQANISDLLRHNVGWYEPEAQLHIPPPAEGLIQVLLEQADAATGTLASDPESASSGFQSLGGPSRSGGAGGFTLRGRATGLHHFGSDNELRQVNTGILESARLLSRGQSGYLLTFSGLGGGTGSGTVPVVASYIQERLQPAPSATFSVCVVPEATSNDMSVDDTRRRDPRLLSNLLCALYYMASTHAINGIILSDNLQLEKQGHRGFANIDRHLQNVLMPIFLSSQARYVYHRASAQLDPANVKLVMSPGQDGTQDFIAACYSRCPVSQGRGKATQGGGNVVAPDPVTRVPSLSDMLEVALRNPTIDCQTGRSRGVLALLSGPGWALERMVPDLSTLVEFDKNVLLPRCIDDEFQTSADQQGWSRFFVAEFPHMTDVRLTVLLRAPRFLALEYALREALQEDEPNWMPGATRGETLAGALRRLEESTVRTVGLRHAM